MKKVSARALFWAVRSAGKSVEEALESLRTLWKEDDGVRRELAAAAKEGFVLVDTKDVPPHFVAAVKVALTRLRERLAPSQPATKVWQDPSKKGREDRKPTKSWSWTSPEGVTYTVYPHDLPPKDKYWTYPDVRAEEAQKWVENFLATGQVEEAPSLWEEALEREDNPHFRLDLLGEELDEGLRFLGWDGNLKELPALADRLPAKEKQFSEALGSIDALVDPEKKETLAVRMGHMWQLTVFTEDILTAVMALTQAQKLVEQGEWSVPEMRAKVLKFSRYIPWDTVPWTKLLVLLDEIAILRRLRHRLQQVTKGRPRAMAYRGPSGEVVLKTSIR